jgi:cytochrome P450
MSLPLPPGKGSLIETLGIFSDPYNFAKKRYERYGAISQTAFLGKKTAVMLGAEANRYVYATNYRNFLWREGYANSIPFYGDAITLVDGDVHDRQRKLMTPAFHSRNMPDYLERINRVIDRQLGTWGANGQRLLYPDIREIAFRLSASLLVGLEVGTDYDRISDLWVTIGKGVSSPLRLNFPFTRYGRALRASHQLNPLLRQLITERRQTPTSDATGLLVNAKTDEGYAFTDDELIDQIKFLIAAGYDTTASTSSWLLVELLRHPEALERVRAEVAGDPNVPITLDDIRAKPYLDAAIKETLRLYPQGFVTPRGVKDGFEFGGFQVPAGWSIMLVAAFTQRMPEYFADPELFDPTRFLVPRDEDAAHPYAWSGFGGGPRTCIGAMVAQIEVKAIVTQLLRRYDLKLVPGQDLTPVYLPVPRAKGNVPITFAVRA